MSSPCTRSRPSPSLLSTLALALALLSLAGCSRETPHAGRLLLLISVDTLRADHVGAFGGPAGLTPRIDRLAARGLVFTRAYTPAPFTLPSVSALLSGRYPEELGIVRNDCALPADVPTLASTLAERGFATGAVVSNFVLRPLCGLARGFLHYDASFPEREAGRGLPERSAPQTTDAALALLDELLARSDDVFLWVHYQDPHGPYTPPAELRQRFLPAERARSDGRRELAVDETESGLGALPAYQVVDAQREVAFYRAGYAGEVAFLDRHLGRLLDGLTARGLDERTTIVFTADHGEALGEGDYWFAHGEQLSEELLRVPLALVLPRGATGRREDTVSLLDLLPTLATLFGGSIASQVGGRDLLADDAAAGASPVYLATLNGASTPRVGLIAEGQRLVLTRQGEQWQPRLFALGSDTPIDDAQRREELGRALTRLFSALPLRPPQWQTRLSEQSRADLRALGYVGDVPPADAGEH